VIGLTESESQAKSSDLAVRGIFHATGTATAELSGILENGPNSSDDCDDKWSTTGEAPPLVRLTPWINHRIRVDLDHDK